MLVTELYAFNLICENLLAALYGVALNIIEFKRYVLKKILKHCNTIISHIRVNINSF